MNPRFLLDTHILVRWLLAPKRLTREQSRILRECHRRGERLALSAITLIELANLMQAGRLLGGTSPRSLLATVDAEPFQVVPITIDIAAEVASMSGDLKDPADRTIVATARVLNLRLLTSDERIIDSRLLSVIA